jgi:glutaminase
LNAGTVASPIQSYLEFLHEKFLALRDGAVADYIPELAKANPEWFGIALVTVDGHVYQVGDTRQPFTIQSISKPIVYGLALEDNDSNAVLARVGVEPTGDAFNSISLDPVTGCPLNPMINAGAVATTGMVAGNGPQERMARILQTFSRYVGHDVYVDEVVYASERDTGHRNRAISHMLRNFGILDGDPEVPLDLYFRQCSISVTARNLALMAGCLANNGVNPITGVVAVKSRYVEKMLSVMSTCGMYDYAGGWIYDVGMPAKSGVAGGILAVLPGQLGIGIFSPPLDAKGNSVRGIAVCRALSEDFNLHMFHAVRTSASVVRVRYDAASVHSKRVRTAGACELLAEHGKGIRVYELHGDLVFCSTEIVINDILGDADEVDFLVLDFKRVLSVDRAACRLLADLARSFGLAGSRVLLTRTRHLYNFTRAMRRALGDMDFPGLLDFSDIDGALEWCEERLLSALPGAGTPDPGSDIAAHEIFAGLDAAELDYLRGVMALREFGPGECIVERGDPADKVFILVEGQANVLLPIDGGNYRLASVSAGMYVGEMAMLDRRPRSANVRAETRVVCYELPFAAIDGEDPAAVAIRATILRNLAGGLARKLRQANMEIRSLA